MPANYLALLKSVEYKADIGIRFRMTGRVRFAVEVSRRSCMWVTKDRSGELAGIILPVAHADHQIRPAEAKCLLDKILASFRPNE